MTNIERVQFINTLLWYNFRIKNMINKKGQVFTPKEYVKKLLYEVDYEGKDIQWNIINDNYLEYPNKIEADYIVSNPPYLTYRDSDIYGRESLKLRFISCEHEKFDYYYTFIEKSIDY